MVDINDGHVDKQVLLRGVGILLLEGLVVLISYIFPLGYLFIVL